MSEKVIPTDVRSSASTGRASWHSRALKLACIASAMALGACMADVGPEEGDEEAESTDQGATANVCQNQAANTFICVDDTHFEQCLGNGGFVPPRSCGTGVFCQTQADPRFNPCVLRAPAGNNNVTPPANNNNNVTPPANNNNVTPPANNNNNSNNVTPPPAPPPPTNPGGGTLRDQFFGLINQDAPGSANVGLGNGLQFITGQCFSNADCASGGCARVPLDPPNTGFRGQCSGPAVCDAKPKQGCGFDVRKGF